MSGAAEHHSSERETPGGESTRADVCIVACAEAFRGDGEILVSPFGTIPRAGARLARLTFSPDLLMTDGEARLIVESFGADGVLQPPVVEGVLPFRHVFDTVWAGRRHAMLGAVQIDGFGNSNLALIGDPARPRIQLIGSRGLPGNTISHTTSYWVPRHGERVFVPHVDFVSGIGHEPSRSANAAELRCIVTNLAVLGFSGPDGTVSLLSVHPGVSVADVADATGFELHIDEPVPVTREPTNEELNLIRTQLDPDGHRFSEVPQ